MSRAGALASAASDLQTAQQQARIAVDQQIDSLSTRHPYLLDELSQLKSFVAAFYSLTLALGTVGRAADKLLADIEHPQVTITDAGLRRTK